MKRFAFISLIACMLAFVPQAGAIVWTFNGGTESWTPLNQITNFGSVSGELSFNYTSAGDPHFGSPGGLSIDTAREHVFGIEVEFAPQAYLPDTFQVFFDVGEGYNEPDSVSWVVQPGRNVYYIDFRQTAHWTGTCYSVRVDPGGNAANLGAGYCKFNYISLTAGINWQFNTAGYTEGWNADSQINVFNATGSDLEVGFPNQNTYDPFMSVYPTYFDGTRFKYIRLRQNAANHNGSDFINAEIHAFPGSTGGFARKPWGYFPNIGYSTSIMDMSQGLTTTSQWTGLGSVTSWRIDGTTDSLLNWQPSGRIYYDYITITDSPADAGPYPWDFAGSGPGTWQAAKHGSFSGTSLNITGGQGIVSGSGTLGIANFDVAIDAPSHIWLVLDMDVNTTAARSDFQVAFYAQQDGKSFGSSIRRNYTFSTNIGMNRYVFNLASVGTGTGDWTGFVHGLMLQLGQGEAGVNSVTIDNIQIVSTPPPYLSFIENVSINDGEAYSQTPIVLAGDPITSWDLVAPASPPSGFNFNASTGQVSWTANMQYSPLAVTVRANNSAGSDTESWTITIPNRAPTNITTSPATVTVNDNDPTNTLIATLTAVDPDPNDTHVFSLLNTAGGRFKLNFANTRQLLIDNAALINAGSATSHQIQVRVTDLNGSGSSYTKYITVNVLDTTPPVAVCQNATVQLDGSGAATLAASQINNGSSDNVAISTLAVSPSSFDCSDVGANSVVLTVTDTSGLTATCQATVTVQDVTPPTAVCQNVTVQLDGSGAAGVTAAQVNNGSSDNCGIANLAISPSTFDCGDVGANAVVLTVTDSNGLTATCQATVSVQDTTAPTAVCKNVTVQLNGAGAASITAAQVNNNSSDNCGIANLAVSPSTFDCGDVGANPVVLTVTDTHGLTATCQATVTVQDTTAPTAICKNVTVQLNGAGAASITAAQVNNNSSDNCGIANLAVSPSSFDCGDVGANPVVLTVTDSNGLTATCQATVTIQDVTAPAAICKNVTVQLNGAGAASITAAQVNNGSSDNCGIANLAVSPSAFDCGDIGANPVVLTVTDSNGLTATCQATVTVQDVTPPTAVCKNVTVQLDASGVATITAAQVNNSSSDNCGIANLAVSPSAFDCGDVGANSVVLTVTDTHGLTATCQATVTVQDATPPTALCQAVSVELDGLGNAAITAGEIDAGSSDNCGVANIDVAPAAFTTADVGDNAVTLTVTDTNGLTATCVTTVHVTEDATPPLISLLGASQETVDCGAGYADPGATASDNLDGDLTASIVAGGDTLSMFTPPSPDPYVITYDVSDSHGNPAVQVTRLVYVLDNCPLDVTIAGGETEPTLAPGGQYTMAVEVTGAVGDLTYQWFKQGSAKAFEPIVGAETAGYTLNTVTDEDAGDYLCEVSDQVTTTESPVIHVTVGAGLPVAGGLGLTFLAAAAALLGAARLRKRK